MTDFDRTLADTAMLGTDAGGQLVRRRVRVRVVDGPDAGVERALERESLVVGSGDHADLVLTDRRCSRMHVELSLLAEGVRVRDLGSRNGTFHREAKVGALVVPVGSRIRVGRTELLFAPEELPLEVAPSDRTSFGGLTGISAEMRRVFAVLAQAAPSPSPVLLSGEAGTGKSLAARGLHDEGGRVGAFVALDLTADPDAEAIRAAYEAAVGGTLLLEHADRARVGVTTALRQRLEAGEGSGGPRLVTTARDDLRALVEGGGFDRDLFFFVAGVRVHLPPLRERPEDVPILLAAFRLPRAPDPRALEALRADGYPGNVRGLRATAEALVAPGVGPEEAPVPFRDAKQQVVEDFEREFVRNLLDQHDGNVSAAARTAGMSRSHLVSLVTKHGLG